MEIQLAYGEGPQPIECPDNRTTVIRPASREGLPDERASFYAALDNPIGERPLKQLIKSDTKICILFPDRTTASASERIIPWLLQYLAHVPRENILLLNQLGTRAPNSRTEMAQILTNEVVNNYRTLNAEPNNRDAHLELGTTNDGSPALIHRLAVEADLRIITGFIEPHFIGGYTGGPMGIMPGVAALETVMSNHSASRVGNAASTFGITYGNPIWEEMLTIAQRPGPCFSLDVTMNPDRQITGVFAGNLIEAHKKGCEFAGRSSMQAMQDAFDVVVTTNNGFPSDLNLHQSINGLSAGARILKEGGTLILAAECRGGVPEHSPMDQLLRTARSPEELLSLLATPGFERPDQWQAQTQALIQQRAEVHLHSALDAKTVRATHLTPCDDISATIAAALDKHGPDARVAVLPQGAVTVPFLAN